MKDPFDRTKVVLRHLPPAISQSVLMEQVDGRFASRYKWLCFLPGKNSQKNQRYSRAYIEFKRPEDVLEFAEFFDGHIFVNEKGTQFKTLVEYAPSQRVPKAWSKKDGREGTIFKDPEYLEFLDLISKPTENLPSAEIQLERKEAERAGGPKEALIVTPLMDFVRQKRATKSGQRSSANGKISKRSGGVSAGSSSPASSKRGSEKRRVPQPMYVLRDTTKSGSGKDKSMFILASRQEEQQLSDKSGVIAAARGTELLEDVTSTNGTISGVSGGVETGKRRIVLLKGKEREISNQHTVASPIKNLAGSTASKHSQRQEGSGRIIKSILSKEMRPSQSPSALYQSEQQLQTLSLDKERRPPRPPNPRGVFKDHTGISLLASISDGDSKRSQDNKTSGYDLHGSVSVGEKQDKRTRNKDRPDRGVWTPLRRSDGSHASDDSLSSSSMAAHVLPDSLEGTPVFQQLAGSSKIGDEDLGNQVARLGCGNSLLPAHDVLFSHGDTRGDMPSSSRSGEGKSQGGGRGGHSLVENGSHRHVGRHGPLHGVREADGSLIISDAKLSKRGGATGYGSHEKRVWVQKSGSGS